MKTLKGIQTTRGLIKYYRHNGIDLPVKCRPLKTSQLRGGKIVPKVEHEELVFALPGGGDFIPGIRLK
jgi:hypothetical protein